VSGEKDISILLGSLAPVLDPEVYTFATVSDSEYEKLERPLGFFRESEGVSVICRLRDAQALGLKHEGEFRKISLSVHSSLHAIGLTARVSTALADSGISCNVVAGYYHDHLFVPVNRADEAKAILCRSG
jgi:uncharacterized protein